MYRNKTATVSEVEGWHCPVCGECEFTNEVDSRRYMEVLNTLIATVKTQEQTFIRHVRKKLGRKSGF
jgi:HTH-type transcriptional regulator/antitoxin MqsA